jgi:hypothetical protein
MWCPASSRAVRRRATHRSESCCPAHLHTHTQFALVYGCKALTVEGRRDVPSSKNTGNELNTPIGAAALPTSVTAPDACASGQLTAAGGGGGGPAPNQRFTTSKTDKRGRLGGGNCGARKSERLRVRAVAARTTSLHAAGYGVCVCVVSSKCRKRERNSIKAPHQNEQKQQKRRHTNDLRRSSANERICSGVSCHMQTTGLSWVCALRPRPLILSPLSLPLSASAAPKT